MWQKRERRAGIEGERANTALHANIEQIQSPNIDLALLRVSDHIYDGPLPDKLNTKACITRHALSIFRSVSIRIYRAVPPSATRRASLWHLQCQICTGGFIYLLSCNAKFLALAVLHDFSQVSPHKLLFLHVCVQQALSIFDRWTASGVKNILATCIHVVTKIPKHVICSICFGCLFGNANAKNSLFIFYCNSFYNSTDSNWNMQVVSFKHK